MKAYELTSWLEKKYPSDATGWEAQNLKFRYMQDKRLMPADRHLANLMMDTMLRPIQKPEDSVIVPSG